MEENHGLQAGDREKQLEEEIRRLEAANRDLAGAKRGLEAANRDLAGAKRGLEAANRDLVARLEKMEEEQRVAQESRAQLQERMALRDQKVEEEHRQKLAELKRLAAIQIQGCREKERELQELLAEYLEPAQGSETAMEAVPSSSSKTVRIARIPALKYDTRVCGLATFEIDLKEAQRFFAQTFSCGASVTGEDEIIIQGDFTDDILKVIQEKWPEVDDESIEVKK